MKSTTSRDPVALRIFDPAEGGLPFILEKLDEQTLPTPVRSNYFTVAWVRQGQGSFHPDLAEHSFTGPVLLFANPYQILLFKSQSSFEGTLLQFHANFLCIETHHDEVGCNGVLFNRLYGEPMVFCDNSSAPEIETLIGNIHSEFEVGGLAHGEILLSLMKILLIKAARMKLDQRTTATATEYTSTNTVLLKLVELIERHYPQLRRPHEYANRLGITSKALARLARKEMGKTPTELIRERMLRHAKWQLLHTLRPVKEIAAQEGFDDEFYFSRLFKAATGFSPTAFREFETRIREGRNLSM